MTLQSLVTIGPQRHMPHDLAVTKQSDNHMTTEAHDLAVTGIVTIGPQRQMPHDLAVTGNHWTTETHAP